MTRGQAKSERGPLIQDVYTVVEAPFTRTRIGMRVGSVIRLSLGSERGVRHATSKPGHPPNRRDGPEEPI
jgi:hypothetical protein